MAKLKITYPTFRQPSVVTFGTGSLRSLRDQPDLDGALYFLSGQSVVREYLAKTLAKADIDLTDDKVVMKPTGEPTVEMIEMGAARITAGKPSSIIGVGGGSVLDWCRLCLAHATGQLDLTTGKVEQGARSQTLTLIPTTCATGAEAANVAVYSNEQGEKIPAVSPTFTADQVILDARFLEPLSDEILAGFLCDAASHAIESFLSLLPIPLANETAVSALQLILTWFPAESTPSRRERLMDASYLGGVAAANASVGVAHAFAHTMATYGISHRMGNALSLAAAMRFNAVTPQMEKLCARMGWSNAEAGIDALRPLLTAAHDAEAAAICKDALTEPAQRASIAERMLGDVCLRSNPRRAEAADVEAFLDDVLREIESR